MIASYALAGELLIALVYVGGAVLATGHALLTKPDPRSVFAWIVMCWLFPLVGPVLYGMFGINRVRTRAHQLRPRVARSGTRVARTPDDQTAQLTRIGDAITQWPQVPGNDVVPLENGDNAFPPMLEAIAGATRSVWLATYIFETDAVGRQFIQALADAATRGVEVRVLVDGIGEWYSWPRAVPALQRAGVRALRFLPPRLVPLRVALNLRNHRKLLLVDGHTGFLGGMNIGGREVGRSSRRRMVDLHFQVRGPVVAQLAQSFGVDWAFTSQEQLNLPSPPPAAGECVCRVITDGPDEDNDKLLFVILGAISVARHRLLIMTPYFIPPPVLTAALQAAALRGVEVSIVLPRRSNLRIVDWASRRWLPPLLERGVRIFLQPPPFSHTKLLVVDGSYAQIGSANLDPRSLRLNFELAMEIYDDMVCARLAAYITRARDRSTAFTAHLAAQQPRWARVRNSLCWLLSPYL